MAQGHDLDNIELNYPAVALPRAAAAGAQQQRQAFVDVSSAAGDGISGSIGSAADWRSGTWTTMAASTPWSPPTGARLTSCTTKRSPQIIGSRFNLIGHKSNRDGIGAVIKLTTPARLAMGTVTTSSGIFPPATSVPTSAWVKAPSSRRLKSAGPVEWCRPLPISKPTGKSR